VDTAAWGLSADLARPTAVVVAAVSHNNKLDTSKDLHGPTAAAKE
jgi:hypothetical protein